ncbi:hypothetical protein K0B96_05740 [Horticoccus luteus]|uniref:Uncharacterized protein n=1 Tax=Horticoccus luteus TaxID=2862869 RepID=A0A8F9TYJ9_9BACT|nr:hypothetical protein [Horticoccus luteus]QYM80118.1 hypothetical protein K0B96_05740 [Horticoccus luteus]
MTSALTFSRLYGARRRQAGFALLLTVTLVAALLVLLVSLVALTRVETKISDNGVKEAQARRNALMALNIALGELQKYAGPDQRVTGTADGFGGVVGTRYYTGVWDSRTTGTGTLRWLVSGGESAAFSPAAAPLDAVELVGERTSATAGESVVAMKRPITAVVAGQSNEAVTGAYAWWVGDEGVKASLAVGDRTEAITYPPYQSGDARARLRQQTGLGAAPTDTAGETLVEPRSASNASSLARLFGREQISLLTTPATAPLGLTVTRDNYHNWTVLSKGVLSDTVRGGLRQDVSLNANLLGEEYAVWADYTNTSVMEDPASPGTPAPSPGYGSEPLRRRYTIGPFVASQRPRIAPVISYFYILFGVRKQSASAPFTLSMRWAVALWNPYTSALVPEPLSIEVTGLPEQVSFLHASTQAVDATVSLRNLYGAPMKLRLPWDSAPTSPDRKSWLPGRVYNWVSTGDPAFTASSTNPGRFYSRDLPGFATGLMTSVAGSGVINGNSPLAVRVGGKTTLTVKLFRDSDHALLATYTSPEYDAVPTTAGTAASNSTSQLGFLFRLAESYDTVASDPGLWLKTTLEDPRAEDYPADGLRAVPNGTNPALYVNYTTISAPDRLLDRDITWGTSFDEDVPVFELPRAPLLSLGALQQLYVAGARPFAIGNSWGQSALINNLHGNELFDRFFLSGLCPGVAPDLAAGEPLPNQMLLPLTEKPDGTAVLLATLQGAAAQRSSEFLLQQGAFNINSLSASAWRAVLHAGRFGDGGAFSYLNPSAATGTAGDASRQTIDAIDAQFFRFPQSAQETFAASDNYAQSTTGANGAGGPVINTPLFRRGKRALSATQIRDLAQQVVTLNRQKQAASGPFRSLEEFLNPNDLFAEADGTPSSLLEKAIRDAGLNEAIGEFSSQWLTQADLVTAIGPVLSARSDTFVVRAYGETRNPVGGNIEGRAWAEAVVQRLPEPKSPANRQHPTEAEYQSPGTLGRRFKILSFRWLSSSDI